jgi:hypothetical protein
MLSYGVTTFQAKSIANILSGNLKVSIKEENGKGWSFNHDENTIYYDPKDLVYLTEEDVIGNLLHEAGHAKYTPHPDSLTWNSKIPNHHIKRLKLLQNVIEDFRIEDKLRAEYPFGKEYLPDESLKAKQVLDIYASYFTGGQEPPYVTYCKLLYFHMAGLPTYKLIDKKLSLLADKTLKMANKGRDSNTGQGVVDIIGTIYPLIKHLLDFSEPPADIFMQAMVPTREDTQERPPLYETLYREIKPLIPSTVAIFQRILTDSKFDKYQGKFRSGRKIDVRKIYKHRLDDFRLFQRLIEARSKDYVFSLVVDESGSMTDNRKIIEAVKTAILFSHVLERLSIPYYVHGFNARLSTYKTPEQPFSERTKRSFEKMIKNSRTEYAAYNDDPRAIFTFGKLMMKYKSKRVMMVMSDGYPEPNDTKENTGFTNLKSTVQKVEKQGIETVGIGILSDAVEEYYKTRAVVWDIKELPQVILQQLKNKLKMKGS